MRIAISLKLLMKIKDRYPLPWFGLHGVIHWHHVYQNGQILSQQEGVNRRVVELFSIFHDSQRINEGRDKGHGKRGADLAVHLREYIPLDNDAFDLLYTACSIHTGTAFHENITVMACIDSDRLDLSRVGAHPDHRQLLSPLAKKREIIEYCSRRNHDLPEKPFGVDNFWDEFGDDDPYAEWSRGRGNND